MYKRQGLTLGVVIFVSVWRTFGISTIILISAMQNVPSDYYEAADIDLSLIHILTVTFIIIGILISHTERIRNRRMISFIG